MKHGGWTARFCRHCKVWMTADTTASRALPFAPAPDEADVLHVTADLEAGGILLVTCLLHYWWRVELIHLHADVLEADVMHQRPKESRIVTSWLLQMSMPSAL